MVYERRLVLLAAGLLTSCDLPLAPAGRAPAWVQIALPTAPVSAGESAPLEFRVFDANDERITNLPPWTARVWASDPSRVRFTEDHVQALRSGTAIIELRVAGLLAQHRLRVNPPTLNVSVSRAYVTQAIQPQEGQLPLVASKDAHLRVLLTGDQDNFFRPTVRAHFYRAGQRVATLETRASDEGVPLQVLEGELRRSWNVKVPASLMLPGLAYQVEVVVDGGLRPTPGSVLLHPPDGLPLPLDVRDVSPLRITFVPIQTGGSVTGSVTTTNVGEFMREAEQVWPLREIDVRVRETYATNRGTSTGADWEGLLRDMQLLRVSDGSTRYYHGIVRRQGGTIAGIGYVSFPVAVSYDTQPLAGETVAHELGHNFGRLHAPCGIALQASDPRFPHPGGAIGAYGLSPDGGTVYAPTVPDLMSYCRPSWVSDYNYGAVFAFRAAEATRNAAVPAGLSELPTGSTLIVSGSVAPGRATIDPAFVLDTEPALPEREGPNTLQGLDEAGGVLFSLSFAGESVADGASEARHFAFAVPLGESTLARLARLRLSGTVELAERRSTVGPALRAELLARAPEPEVSAEATEPGLYLLSWEAERYPLLVVRNPETGRIIARVSGGSASIHTEARDLELMLSDGVTSLARRLRLEPR